MAPTLAPAGPLPLAVIRDSATQVMGNVAKILRMFFPLYEIEIK